MSHQSAIAAINAMTVWSLAHAADATSPDRDDSPGAELLTDCRDAVVEFLEDNPDASDTDRMDFAMTLGEMKSDRGVVPYATWVIWRTFVDLGAWQEDDGVDMWRHGDDSDGVDYLAVYCLGAIVERLGMALMVDYESEVDE
jgi:hypothetical protein